MPNMSLKKNEMPSQEPNVRNKNFLEVALGYTEEQALDEAARCLNCKNHPCVSGCPVQVKIPEFIKKITEKDYEGAYQVIHETSSLPAVCGRVCPQETQCESKCIRGIKGEPVGIGRLERFVADWHNANVQEAPAKPVSNGHKVAVIGSGPAVPDPSTSGEALEAAGQAGLLPDAALEALLRQETPKMLENARWHVVGGVRLLCAAAEETCRRLGYAPFVLTDRLSCEAREAGRFLSAAAQYHAGRGRALALLAGGETVVHVTGSGLGGRNQELALAAAPGLEGLSDAAVFSFGSDGTDGPTDAAGGYADGRTAAILRALGRTAEAWLDDNDALHALAQTGGLLRTGPTGTNVNDLSVLLIGKPRLTF